MDPRSPTLEGRVAIVTGATGDIGRVIARRLAEAGARLVLGGRREEPGPIPDDAVYVAGEVASDEGAARLVATARDTFGRLDALINAHGIDFHSELPDTDLRAALRVLEVNLLGALATMKHALPALAATGDGAVVNVASRLGLVAIPGQAVYSASKGGLIMLSKGAAIDYARRGVRVNVVAPGMTATAMIDEWVAGQPDPIAFRRQLEVSIPIGRMAGPEEVAEAVLFLASPASAGITGAVLSVDGGYTAA